MDLGYLTQPTLQRGLEANGLTGAELAPAVAGTGLKLSPLGQHGSWANMAAVPEDINQLCTPVAHGGVADPSSLLLGGGRSNLFQEEVPLERTLSRKYLSGAREVTAFHKGSIQCPC